MQTIRATIAVVLSLYLLCPPQPAGAQSPTLVADIENTPSDLSPQFISAMNGGFLFLGSTTESGREFWFTDGSPGGTHQVKDLTPGPADTQIFLGYKTFNIGGKDILIFAFDDGVHGVELWRTDGTDSGTFLIEDLNPGPASSYPSEFGLWTTAAAPTTRIIFSATVPSTGTEPYWTDASLNSINLAADISAGSSSSQPRYFTRAGSLTYFVASNATNGREIWRVNSAGSFILIKDIESGITSSNPNDFAPAPSGGIYFAATTAAAGEELWYSGGTSATTYLVKDLVAGTGGSQPRDFVNVGPLTFFVAYSNSTGGELARTDGTAGGTFLVKDIFPGTTSSLYSLNLGFSAALGSTLLFLANDSTHGLELWKSDGTAIGTSLVKDIFPGPASGFVVPQLTAFGGKIFFIADDGQLGREVWSSDGTAAGTLQVDDTYAGAPGSSPTIFGALSGYLYFSAESPISQLWKTSGTSASTVSAVPFSTNSGGTSSSYPRSLVAMGERLLFAATTRQTGDELWSSDGSTSGTSLIANISPGSSSSAPLYIIPFGSRILFAASDPNYGSELWSSDGTNAGTARVLDIYPGTSGSGPSDFIQMGAFVYFVADDGTHGRELWRTDGTAAGTSLVADIYSGSTSSSPVNFKVVNGQLLFAATTSLGYELWRSDGTGAGTSLVMDINPGAPNGFTGIFGSAPTVLGNRLYFVADDGTHGSELWQSDGTGVGTKLVKDLRPGAPAPSFSPLVVLGDKLIFGLFDGSTTGLWKSDGTSAGTSLIRSTDSIPFSLETHGSRVYFLASDLVTGEEPWVSDGTPEGTTVLKDIVPGTGSSKAPFGLNFYQINSSAPYFFFSAVTADAGEELWRTDGTSSGTVRITDLNPGAANSSPRVLAYTNGTLYFSATSPATGYELWAMVLEPCLHKSLKLIPGTCGNPPDLCPQDPSKLNPGTCGCGVADTDTNGNSIIDCLAGPEFSFRLKQFQTSFAGLKFPKNAKKKKQARAIAAQARTLAEELVSYGTSNAAQISVRQGYDFGGQLASLNKFAKATFALKLKTYRKASKNLKKAINSLSSNLA